MFKIWSDFNPTAEAVYLFVKMSSSFKMNEENQVVFGPKIWELKSKIYASITLPFEQAQSVIS